MKQIKVITSKVNSHQLNIDSFYLAAFYLDSKGWAINIYGGPRHLKLSFFTTRIKFYLLTITCIEFNEIEKINIFMHPRSEIGGTLVFFLSYSHLSFLYSVRNFNLKANNFWRMSAKASIYLMFSDLCIGTTIFTLCPCPRSLAYFWKC